MIKRINRKIAVRLCAEMWEWLAKNPGNSKAAWPQWSNLEKKYGEITHYCFACHLCEQQCRECFMIELWPNSCNVHDSVYEKWLQSDVTIGQKKYATIIAKHARKVLASL